MLPALENTPGTPEEWMRWAFDHRDSHNRIRAKIRSVYGIDLFDYPVEPINPETFSNFLQNNAELHGDMNAVLKLQSGDLEDADLSKEAELLPWIRLHYQEHLYAELSLGI